MLRLTSLNLQIVFVHLLQKTNEECKNVKKQDIYDVFIKTNR